MYRVTKGMKIIASKSRADYFRKLRESKKTFSVTIEKEKLEKLESKLSESNKTKTEWLNQKIDEEIGE